MQHTKFTMFFTCAAQSKVTIRLVKLLSPDPLFKNQADIGVDTVFEANVGSMDCILAIVKRKYSFFSRNVSGHQPTAFITAWAGKGRFCVLCLLACQLEDFCKHSAWMKRIHLNTTPIFAIAVRSTGAVNLCHQAHVYTCASSQDSWAAHTP